MEIFGFAKDLEQIKTTLKSGNRYRLKKWNAATTTVQGFKLLKVFMPMLTMYADVKSESMKVDELSAMLEDNSEYVFTKGFMQVSEQLTPEHFVDLQEKLLCGLEVFDKDKEEWVSVGDWSEFFSTEAYGQDWMEAVIWSFKVNLLDFLQRQSMFASVTESVMTTLAPLLDKIKK